MATVMIDTHGLSPPPVRPQRAVAPEGEQMSGLSYMERSMWDKARDRLYWPLKVASLQKWGQALGKKSLWDSGASRQGQNRSRKHFSLTATVTQKFHNCVPIDIQ
ncbi:hypothetical protein CEXT_178931 [Caerostris extrusa]|uniref:Uncharacterized protein n=1 Tax=Caerostris extrusa TaxID=172846 RepID=A0AAV4S0F7_CAEEX|nr:hypothetical protein CEXT_178931 [Caerostris extrusa]